MDGDITGGYALVTKDSFNNDASLPAEEKGKFTITSDAEVVFMDTVSGALSIKVNSGVHATVGIYANMNLSNENVQRAAIDIDSGGVLNMYLGEGVKVNVNSGVGATVPLNTGNGAYGGHGGYAGIHVPEGAVLNIKGPIELSEENGYAEVTAYGGNASSGGTAAADNAGGGGGGGAGAGIGGNGGTGGNSGSRYYGDIFAVGKVFSYSGCDGDDGESCGEVNIYGYINVNAYGGAGGSGGTYYTSTGSSGTGGGGYPAAGIGGGGAGGAGGDHIKGGGGYSGGVGQFVDNGYFIKNGKQDVEPVRYSDEGTGGSYFSNGMWDDARNYPNFIGMIGGQGGGAIDDNYWVDTGGDGGIAGRGGTIKVSKKSNVYAYNGNECTLLKTEEGYYYKPLEIFAQGGILRKVYKHNCWWGVKPKCNYEFFSNLFGDDLEENVDKIIITASSKENPEKSDVHNYLIRDEKVESATRKIKTSYQNKKASNSVYGIGSGAGYIELSNGTYAIYNEDNNGNFTTVYAGE